MEICLVYYSLLAAPVKPTTADECKYNILLGDPCGFTVNLLVYPARAALKENFVLAVKEKLMIL